MDHSHRVARIRCLEYIERGPQLCIGKEFDEASRIKRIKGGQRCLCFAKGGLPLLDGGVGFDIDLKGGSHYTTSENTLGLLIARFSGKPVELLREGDIFVYAQFAAAVHVSRLAH